MGVERLISLLEEAGITPQDSEPHAYLVLVGEESQRQGVVIAEKLRDELPKLRLIANCGGGSFKSQFKKADRSEAQYALIIGEDELTRGVIGVKSLRSKEEQHEVKLDELTVFLQQKLWN
jgi:histidyl-tRNA synthetase